MKTFANYWAFWPHYVSEHYHPGNRRLHFIGVVVGLVCLALAVTQAQPLWLIGMPLFGYGFAWIGHFFVQRNIPATFHHPLWSLRGDFHMFYLMCLGRMD